MIKKFKTVLLNAAVLVALLFTIQVTRAEAPKKVHLGLHYSKGDKYHFAMAMDMNIGIDTIKMHQVLNMGADVHVENVDAEGNLYMHFRYTDIRFSQKTGNAEISYSSLDPNSDSTNLMVIGYSALKNAYFNLKVSPDGHKIEMTDYDQLVRRLVDRLVKGASDSTKDLLAGRMKQFLPQKKLCQTFEQAWNIYPDKAVGIGDTWDKEINDIMGMQGNLVTTYTLKELNQGSATLSAHSVANDLKIKTELGSMVFNGDQTGTTIVDVNTGNVINSRLAQHMICNPGNVNPGAKTMDMNSVFSLNCTKL